VVLLVDVSFLYVMYVTVAVVYGIVYLVVAIASTRYCSGVEPIPGHIPVVIYLSSSEDLLTVARSSVLPREELRCIAGLCWRHFRYI